MSSVIKVNVTRLHKLGGSKALKAFANIEIENNGTLTAIDGVKVFDKEEGKGPWIAMPQTSYVDKKGETKWNDIITLDQTSTSAVQDVLVNAYHNPDFTGAKSQKPQKKTNARAVEAKDIVAPSEESRDYAHAGSEDDIPF